MGILTQEKLEVQAARDERDLKAVVVLSYISMGLYGIVGLFVLCGAIAGLLGIPLFLGFGAVINVIVAFVSAACLLGLAYANWMSAKAIKAREDAIFSIYIAGINTCMSFPIGLLIGGYTWHVLSRQSVQDLYQLPLRGAPSLETKKAQKQSKPRLVIAPEQTATPPINFAEAMAHADEQEEALWKTIEEEHRRRNPDEDA